MDGHGCLSWVGWFVDGDRLPAGENGGPFGSTVTVEWPDGTAGPSVLFWTATHASLWVPLEDGLSWERESRRRHP